MATNYAETLAAHNERIRTLTEWEGGDDRKLFRAIIDRSVTEICSEARIVCDHTFRDCSGLITADFPLATSIGTYAFYQCDLLASVNIPLATSIGDYAFAKCTSITDVNYPLVTSVGGYAFQYCDLLTSANFPLVRVIGSGLFQYCDLLTSVNFPSATNIGTNGFCYCTSLVSAKFESVTTVSQYAFQGCSKLETIDFHKVTSFGGTFIFNRCSKLTTVIIRSETVCKMSNANVLSNTPIKSGTGYVYVPSALVDTYKAATNWSTYANQFRALEDYTVDGTITGELDTTKI